MNMKSWTENHGHEIMDRKSWTGKLKQGKFQGGTPRYSVLTWIATHDLLATGVRVLKWNPQSDSRVSYAQATWKLENTSSSAALILS
ncbi:hypothetical protein F2Q69_00001293 [Brassica cretica]|uniref:Reverse transcriptase zinc-binding domain-containing protein n=1 Tax=Brassica cretica TaxID=69181 RepID=A0A8S9NNN4_BRACR|nr:hypothetical protein F2Q69_00001293 [Brassica cretica]